MDRVAEITKRLTDAFAPSELVVTDESHMHVGHAGAASGAGHFHVLVRAEAFAGKLPIQRHRMVFAAVDDMMETEIHALSIDAAGADA